MCWKYLNLDARNGTITRGRPPHHPLQQCVILDKSHPFEQMPQRIFHPRHIANPRIASHVRDPIDILSGLKAGDS
jgi:hypothetical protein